MKRKLFCEISPLTYQISHWLHCLKRSFENLFNHHLAKNYSEQKLPFVVYRSNSLIRRTLGDVDPQLQENKAINLAIACPCVSHLIIRPHEEFSIWSCIGKVNRKKGYQEGLYVYHDSTGKGIGGGLCQLSNLIHWMVLHSPLEISEHHHHDQIDMFPDYGRSVPFGTGTSISYNYIDYRFVNSTEDTFQLILYTNEKYLCGELRCSSELPNSYHVQSVDEHFRQEEDGVYRCGQVIRSIVDKKTGRIVKKECIKENHAKIQYDVSFVKDHLR